jgi:hypothetical protein
MTTTVLRYLNILLVGAWVRLYESPPALFNTSTSTDLLIRMKCLGIDVVSKRAQGSSATHMCRRYKIYKNANIKQCKYVEMNIYFLGLNVLFRGKT